MGADWHQRAISSLCNGLCGVAAQQGWPWHVGNQLPLVAWHPDGSPWTPSPDIMVHPEAGPDMRERIVARDEGVPALVIEVISATTWRNDVGVEGHGKAFEYLSLGVREYLVFDPTGDRLEERCRAWRQVEGAREMWQSEADGRYYSQTLSVSFGPEGLFLRIFDPAGNAVPFDHERAQLHRALLRENLALRAEVARLRGEDPPVRI